MYETETHSLGSYSSLEGKWTTRVLVTNRQLPSRVRYLTISPHQRCTGGAPVKFFFTGAFFVTLHKLKIAITYQ